MKGPAAEKEKRKTGREEIATPDASGQEKKEAGRRRKKEKREGEKPACTPWPDSSLARRRRDRRWKLNLAATGSVPLTQHITLCLKHRLLRNLQVLVLGQDHFQMRVNFLAGLRDVHLDGIQRDACLEGSGQGTSLLPAKGS